MEGYCCPNCGARFVTAMDLVDAADSGCDQCGQKFEVTESERGIANEELERERIN